MRKVLGVLILLHLFYPAFFEVKTFSGEKDKSKESTENKNKFFVGHLIFCVLEGLLVSLM